MPNDLKYVLLFILMLAIGVLLEVIIARIYNILTSKNLRSIHFTFGRYLFLMIIPIFTILLFGMKLKIALTEIFVTFSIVGTILEYLVGFSYHEIVGQRLWTYHRYSLKGYTSLLSLPLWGLGGVLFWLLAQAFV